MGISDIGGIPCTRHRRTRAYQTISAPPSASLSLPIPETGEARALPLVKAGDAVLLGQLLAASPAPSLAPLHAPVSGRVLAVTRERITLADDGEGRLHPACVPFTGRLGETDTEELLDFVEATGLTVPGTAHDALAEKIRTERGKVHTLLLDGIDDEPYGGLSSHLLITRAEEVLLGLKLLLALYGIAEAEAVLAIDQVSALNRLSLALTQNPIGRVRKIRPRYPVKTPRHLILTLYRKEQKKGMSLGDTGYAVYPPETLLELYDAFATGIPLVKKTVLLEGKGLKVRGVAELPLGADILPFVSMHLRAQKHKVLAGRGMLSAVPIPAQGVIGKESAVLLTAPKSEARGRFLHLMNTPANADACIGCGKCVPVCPSELPVAELMARMQDGKPLLPLGAAVCLGCGCCSYVCPAGIAVHDLISAAVRQERTGIAPAAALPDTEAQGEEDGTEADGEETEAPLPDGQESPLPTEGEAKEDAREAIESDASDEPEEAEAPDAPASPPSPAPTSARASRGTSAGAAVPPEASPTPETAPPCTPGMIDRSVKVAGASSAIVAAQEEAPAPFVKSRYRILRRKRAGQAAAPAPDQKASTKEGESDV